MDIDKIPKTVRTPELEKELAGKSFKICQTYCGGKPGAGRGNGCTRKNAEGYRFIGAVKVGKTKLGKRVCIKIESGENSMSREAMRDVRVQEKRGKSENDILQKWQKKLRLDDWEIILRTNARPCEIWGNSAPSAADKNIATVSLNRNFKTAVVEIIDEKLFVDSVRKFDLERGIAGALLHVKLNMVEMSADEKTQTIINQIVTDLSCALVEREN